MIRLYVSEEYGYRDWVAILTPEEWEELKRRWQTMRGLNCLVPVRLIVPQARPRYANEPDGGVVAHCHIHQHDDSSLNTVMYEIPEAEHFEMDGVVYTSDDLAKLNLEVTPDESSEFDMGAGEDGGIPG